MHYHEDAIEETYLKSSNERYRVLFFIAVDRYAHILYVTGEFSPKDKEFYIRLNVQREVINGDKVDNWRKWYYRVLARIEQLLN